MNTKDLAKYTERLRGDYAFFVHEIWTQRGWHTRHPWTHVEDDLCGFVGDFSTTRKCVLAYREYGKTTIVGLTYPCWRWFRDCDNRVLMISKGASHTGETSHGIKGLLRDIPFLMHLIPGQSMHDRDNKMAFDVAGCSTHRQPSYKGLGIGGQTEGNHVDVVIPDDLETKENSWTVEGREKLKHLAKEIENIVYKPNDEHRSGKKDPPTVVVLGTPKDDDSWYSTLEARGYTVYSYPQVIPNPGEKVIGILAPSLRARIDRGDMTAGSIISPKRHDRHDLDKLRTNIGPSEYDREYKLLANLSSTNRHPLRISNFIVMDEVDRDRAPLTVTYGQSHNGVSTAIQDIARHGFEGDNLYRPIFVSQERAPYQITHAAIDPAFGGHDKTGLAIGGFLAGKVHVKLVRGLTGGSSPEALMLIARLLREHGVNRVYIEQNQGRGMFDQLLWPVLQSIFVREGDRNPAYPKGWSCSIEKDQKIVNAYGQHGKDERIISTIEPPLSSHRIVIARSAIAPDQTQPATQSFQYQLTHMTREKHSLGKPGVGEYGMSDAFAMLLRSFASYLDVDCDVQADDARSRGDHRGDEIERAMQELETLQGRFAAHGQSNAAGTRFFSI